MRSATFPLFCKPIAASNGLYAEVMSDAPAFDDFAARVSREHFAILIQPFLSGVEHRVFVLEGRVLFSYRKHLPRIAGDGRSTASALIEALPRESAPPLERTRLKSESGRLFGLDGVPARGELLTLEGPANRAAGGGAGDLVDGAPSPLAQLALAATQALGLGLAAVDAFDLSPAGDLTQLCIIEVNSNPMIKTLEDHDRWDLIDEIWRANFAAALR